MSPTDRNFSLSDADYAAIVKRYEDTGDVRNADIIRKQWDVARGGQLAAGMALMACGAADVCKALGLDVAQGDAGIPVSVQVQRETAGDAGAAQTCWSRDEVQAQQEQNGAGLACEAPASGASLALPPLQSVDHLVAALVDRDTPLGLDDEVVDWDLHGKPITRRMVESFAKTTPRPDQLALELPTGAPVIRNVSAAIDAAAAEAATQGVTGLNLPANRARATVLDEEILATVLWLYRRLHRCYGRPPTVERPIKALAALVGIDVADCLAERGPDTEGDSNAQ